MKKPFILLSLLCLANTVYAAPKCHTIYSKDDYDNTEICRYPNTSVARVYQQYRQKQLKHLTGEYRKYRLLPTMPKKAVTVYPDPQSQAPFIYTPIKNGLHIEQNFEGGITTIIFTQRGKNVEVKTISSPD